jgi:hypothetical protein
MMSFTRAPRFHACAIICIAALSLVASLANAADWTDWRGPAGDGVSPETNVLTSQPTVAWTVDLGFGYTPATVVGDRVYCAGWTNDNDTVYCLSGVSI